jgi:hypothetical protein
LLIHDLVDVGGFTNTYCRYPQTLIVCIIGLFQILHNGKTAHYIVMENILHGATMLKFHEMYDLKGSAIDRRCVNTILGKAPASGVFDLSECRSAAPLVSKVVCF